MNRYLSIIFSLAVISAIMLDTGCKKKKEQPMVDIESIDVDGSYDDRYIFRNEIRKDREKKAKADKMSRELSE